MCDNDRTVELLIIAQITKTIEEKMGNHLFHPTQSLAKTLIDNINQVLKREHEYFNIIDTIGVEKFIAFYKKNEQFQ